jgi:hypothetical protein
MAEADGVADIEADSDVVAIKTAGNELYRQREYHAAAEKYSEALGGPESFGDKLHPSISWPIILNRAACHLELADAMIADEDERLQAYERARRDASHTLKWIDLLKGRLFPKALFRAGRAELSMLRIQFDRLGELAGARLLDHRRKMAEDFDNCCTNLEIASSLQPKDETVKTLLDEAKTLQRKLEGFAAPPLPLDGIPMPTRESFPSSVQFQQGIRWIDNRVALEIPITREGKTAHLPVYLTKQHYEPGMGELQILMHNSDHLGKDELRKRHHALNMKEEYDGIVHEVWGSLSTPAQAGENIQRADEFLLSLRFFRKEEDKPRDEVGVPAALEALNVIEFVRVAAHTGLGEEFRAYRVKF